MKILEFNPNIITPEEQDDMAMAAFIGALDDIVLAESTVVYNETSARSGGIITERVLGLFDTASTFYNEDMVRSFELVNSLASRLGELAMIRGCMAHNHNQMLDFISETYGLKQDDGHNHSDIMQGEHSHEDDDDEYEIDPRTGKKTNRKRSGFFRR